MRAAFVSGAARARKSSNSISPRFERLSGARHDQRLDLVIRLRERGLQHRLDGAADQRGLGARMFEHVGEIVGGEQRVDRDRNDAREHARPRRRPASRRNPA